MELDQFLVITRNKEFGNIGFMGPMTGAELEKVGEGFADAFETFGVPLTDVLALAGDHEDSGPIRMMQPMTVDQVALRIMAALYVTPNELTPEQCAAWAWDGAALFMYEAMQRDAMGVPLQSDEPDQGEDDNGEDTEKENGEGGEGSGADDDASKGPGESEG